MIPELRRSLKAAFSLVAHICKVLASRCLVPPLNLLLVSDLPKRFETPCTWIDGRIAMDDRLDLIDSFSDTAGSAVLVLNPMAAGTGLNITAANHVIHYNLEWNPAVEDQASARAYRRGQTRPVTVHRLFYANTIEDVINERVERKRRLAEAAVVGTDWRKQELDDLLRAVAVSPTAGEVNS